VTTNLPFLRWLVAHPAVRAGRTTTAFLSEYAPLSAPPVRLPSGPWDGAWRLNLPPPAPHAPPDTDELVHAAAGPSGGGQSALTAPMPGTVIKVLVAPGDQVEPRQTLLVLEAMKMETPVVSPYAATVQAVHVGEGDRVAGGAVLVELEE
jgi:biotin carboxyl carrier protein